MPRSSAAVSPNSTQRIEPSLSGQVPATPRLVPADERGKIAPRPGLRAAAASTELRAGERSVVVSTSGAASQGDGALLRKAAVVAVFVLALVGAASLLKGVAGL